MNLGPQWFQRCLLLRDVAYSAKWCMWGRGKAQPWFKSLHNLSVWVFSQIILSVLRHFIVFSLDTSLPFFLPESDGQDAECGPGRGFPSEWGGREAGGAGWIVSKSVLQWEGRGSRSCLLELRDARRELTMGGEGYGQGHSMSSGVIPSSHHIHSCWGRAGWEGEGTKKTLLPWCTLLKHAGLWGWSWMRTMRRIHWWITAAWLCSMGEWNNENSAALMCRCCRPNGSSLISANERTLGSHPSFLNPH